MYCNMLFTFASCSDGLGDLQLRRVSMRRGEYSMINQQQRGQVNGDENNTKKQVKKVTGQSSKTQYTVIYMWKLHKLFERVGEDGGG